MKPVPWGILWILWAAAGAAEEPLQLGVYKGRSVWFQAQDGLAIIEGDIILGTVDELVNPKSAARNHASTLPGDANRWPAGEIPYAIDAALPNRERVLDAIARWHASTPIRLVERGSQADYVQFTRAASGCNSSVGRVGGQQRVNLGDECTVSAIIHEIGHAIGLWHTQSRIDRERYIRVLYQRIDKSYWSAFDQHIHDGEDLGPYDYASIMHYSMWAFQRSFGQAMETVPPGIPIGQRIDFSSGDIEAVLRLYGQKPELVTIDTNPQGLPVVIDGSQHVAPVALPWAAGEEHTVSVAEMHTASPTTRLRFGRWGDDAPRERTIVVGDNWRSYTAHFIEEVLVRTGVTPADAGTVRTLPESPDGYYTSGTQLRFQAMPAAGFSFLNWQAGVGGVTALAASGQGASANPVEAAARFNNLFYVAAFTRNPVTTITSDPPGRTISVDGTAILTPVNYAWTVGSTHTVSVGATQTGTGGVSQYRFTGWRHGGPASQTLTAAATATYTAAFSTHYRVSATVRPYVLATAARPGQDNVTIEPNPADGFHQQGSTVRISATDGAGFRFANWTGDLTGTANPQTLTVTDQVAVSATFLSPLLIWNTSIVNDATLQPATLSPGQLVTIYSPDIGPDNEIESSDGDNGRRPTVLAGRSVLFDGIAAPILRASRDRLLVQVPDEIAGKTRVALSIGGVAYNFPRPVGVLQAHPGIYTADGTGRGQAMAFLEDGSPNGPSAAARIGTEITVVVTGVGLLDPPPPPGAPISDPSTRISLPVRAWIGGREARVAESVRAGPQGPGAIAIAIEIPNGTEPGPRVPVLISVGSRQSQDFVTIAVAP